MRERGLTTTGFVQRIRACRALILPPLGSRAVRALAVLPQICARRAIALPARKWGRRPRSCAVRTRPDAKLFSLGPFTASHCSRHAYDWRADFRYPLHYIQPDAAAVSQQEELSDRRTNDALVSLVVPPSLRHSRGH